MGGTGRSSDVGSAKCSPLTYLLQPRKLSVPRPRQHPRCCRTRRDGVRSMETCEGPRNRSRSGAAAMAEATNPDQPATDQGIDAEALALGRRVLGREPNPDEADALQGDLPGHVTGFVPRLHQAAGRSRPGRAERRSGRGVLRGEGQVRLTADAGSDSVDLDEFAERAGPASPCGRICIRGRRHCRRPAKSPGQAATEPYRSPRLCGRPSLRRRMPSVSLVQSTARNALCSGSAGRVWRLRRDHSLQTCTGIPSTGWSYSTG